MFDNFLTIFLADCWQMFGRCCLIFLEKSVWEKPMLDKNRFWNNRCWEKLWKTVFSPIGRGITDLGENRFWKNQSLKKSFWEKQLFLFFVFLDAIVCESKAQGMKSHKRSRASCATASKSLGARAWVQFLVSESPNYVRDLL